jgi:hypothetical protein
MKRIILTLACSMLGNLLFGQSNEISDYWTAFTQSRDASFLKKKTKFKLTAQVKVVSDDKNAWAGLWARVDNKGGEQGFFDNMNNRRIMSGDWQVYSIEGTMDEKAEVLYFGGLCQHNGKFYFDNFQLEVENDRGLFQSVTLENPGFEATPFKNKIPSWSEGIKNGFSRRVKEYTFAADDDRVEGSFSLLVTGEKITDAYKNKNRLLAAEGFTPQIGILVSMLNDLSNRVEQTVKYYTENQADFLLDDNANSVGALIMHLAATEVFYQVWTFEGREFNEEEKEKWEVPFQLGDKARKLYKGQKVEYYLDIWKEVRKNTLEELSKRNDEWLSQDAVDSDWNNFYCWYHVMEHQSSHLGQIRLIKKRFPKEEKKEKIKIQMND